MSLAFFERPSWYENLDYDYHKNSTYMSSLYNSNLNPSFHDNPFTPKFNLFPSSLHVESSLPAEHTYSNNVENNPRKTKFQQFKDNFFDKISKIKPKLVQKSHEIFAFLTHAMKKHPINSKSNKITNLILKKVSSFFLFYDGSEKRNTSSIQMEILNSKNFPFFVNLNSKNDEFNRNPKETFNPDLTPSKHNENSDFQIHKKIIQSFQYLTHLFIGRAKKNSSSVLDDKLSKFSKTNRTIPSTSTSKNAIFDNNASNKKKKINLMHDYDPKGNLFNIFTKETSHTSYLNQDIFLIAEILCLIYIMYVSIVELVAYSSHYNPAKWLLALCTIAIFNLAMSYYGKYSKYKSYQTYSIHHSAIKHNNIKNHIVISDPFDIFHQTNSNKCTSSRVNQANGIRVNTHNYWKKYGRSTFPLASEFTKNSRGRVPFDRSLIDPKDHEILKDLHILSEKRFNIYLIFKKTLHQIFLFFVKLAEYINFFSCIYSRMLRPIIFCLSIGTFRNIIATILRTIPKVRHVFCLIIIGIILFDWLGLLVFAGSSNKCEFHSFLQGCVSLMLMVTTANPEVLLSGYVNNRLTVLFFVAFHVIIDVLLLGLLTAAFYDTYSSLISQDLRMLERNKDKCLEFIFRIISDATTHEITSISWQHLAHHLKQFDSTMGIAGELETSNCMLSRKIFGMADVDASGGLNFYEFSRALTELNNSTNHEKLDELRGGIKNCKWNHENPRNVRRIDLFVDCIVLISLLMTLLQTYQLIQATNPKNNVLSGDFRISSSSLLSFKYTFNLFNDNKVKRHNKAHHPYNVASPALLESSQTFPNFIESFNDYSLLLSLASFLIFIFVFYKIKRLGINLYWNGFHSLRNRFDLVMSIIIGIFELWNIFFSYFLCEEFQQIRLIFFFRIFRSLRLVFRIHSFQILLESLTSVVSAFSTVLGLLFILFYSYAMIGMQMFGGLIEISKLSDLYRLNDTSLISNSLHSVKYSDVNVEDLGLLNFNEFSSSLITLFVLMINGWHTSLEELVLKTSAFWCIVYFVTFYILADMILLNLFVTLTLEAYGKLLLNDTSTTPMDPSLVNGERRQRLLGGSNSCSLLPECTT